MRKLKKYTLRIGLLAIACAAAHYAWATTYFEMETENWYPPNAGWSADAIGNYNGTEYGRTVASYSGTGIYLWEQACGYYFGGSGDHWYHTTVGPVGSISVVRDFDPATFQSGQSYIYDINNTSNYAHADVHNNVAP